ncbi:hypothetical protein F0P96_04465 [Hymenobacter busanensis]|uniref:Uncharacterized protein n=1 Tax=Hymenobacter busanensis TaxID=2607656 RepID=A0A7L4ZTS4_9BACT|nr:hypothetical protein [Hymenobacter busanensis]KAA9339876.1 hypothetical protein F0P96_04465 [Hymenobacter busanensis]QHJ06367.1 hypothetical protein GUY19_03260 [Hymenobacter busanensis]
MLSLLASLLLKNAITLDWLTLSLSGALEPVPVCPVIPAIEAEIGRLLVSGTTLMPVGYRSRGGSFTFVNLDRGTAQYKRVLQIQYEGKPWGTLCAVPRSSILPPDSMQLKLENCVLYEEELRLSLVAFFGETGFVLNGITRLDIACDFERFANGMLPGAFIQAVQSAQIERKGRAANTNVFMRGGAYTGIKWGSQTSDRCATMYNKTLELKKSNKPYITKYLLAAGLGVPVSQFDADGLPLLDEDGNQKTEAPDVWRMEFKLKSDELKKLYHFPEGQDFLRVHKDLPNDLYGEEGELVEPLRLGLYDFVSAEWLKSVFQKELDTYLTFVEDSDDSNKSRRPALRLFDFAQPDAPKLLRHSTRPGTTSFRFKVSIKALLGEYWATKDNDSLHMACQLMQQHDLAGHVEKRLKHWQREFMPSMDMAYNYANPVALVRASLTLGETERFAGIMRAVAADPLRGRTAPLPARLRIRCVHTEPGIKPLQGANYMVYNGPQAL